ncbi:MAG: hypothetical protein WBA88_10480 [Pseudaminobacter sp.]
MSGAGYISDFRADGIGEAHLLASEKSVSAYAPLVCRWPQGRVPEGFVVFCHGLGSNGGEYAALSREWASRGYLVIHPTFSDWIVAVAKSEPELGLDPRVDLAGWTAMPDVKARLHEILHAPERWLARIEIVRAVLAMLPRIFEESCGTLSKPLRGAIAGHSFGAYTAQLLAGAEIDLPGGGTGRFHDDRFSAGVLLSAQGRDQQGLRDGSWQHMSGPVLTVTGTLDRGAKGGDWHWKSEPYTFSPAGGKYLAVLEEGDHFLGGFAEGGVKRQVPGQRKAVEQLTLAFLDAHVRCREAASAWLGSIGDAVGECRLLFRRK